MSGLRFRLRPGKGKNAKNSTQNTTTVTEPVGKNVIPRVRLRPSRGRRPGAAVTADTLAPLQQLVTINVRRCDAHPPQQNPGNDNRVVVEIGAESQIEGIVKIVETDVKLPYNTRTTQAHFEQQRTEDTFYQIESIDTETDEADKIQILESAMDLDQTQRFKCYMHSALSFKTVRGIMQRISGNQVDPVCVWTVCDLTKEYVEDIMNAALDYQQSCGETGPVSAEALIAADFQLKLSNL